METIEMETIEVFGIDSQRLRNIAEPLVGAMFKTGNPKLRPDLLKIATAAAFTQVLDHYEVTQRCNACINHPFDQERVPHF